MAIIKGHPLRWQEVIDSVTAHYLSFISLLPEDLKRNPFEVWSHDDPRNDDPRNYNSGTATCIFLAMISPPNMPSRPESISGPVGTYNLLSGVGGAYPEIGAIGTYPAGVRLSSGLFAADTFVEMISADYTAPFPAPGPAGDILIQVDAYRVANPKVRVLGFLIDDYICTLNPGTPEEVSHGISTCKLAGRLFP